MLHYARESYVIRVAHRCEMNAATHKLGLRGFCISTWKERKKERKKEKTATGEACNNNNKRKKNLNA